MFKVPINPYLYQIEVKSLENIVVKCLIMNIFYILILTIEWLIIIWSISIRQRPNQR